MTTKPLRAGQRFARDRKFKPSEHGVGNWWLIGPRSDEVGTAIGAEVIDILELLETASVGRLVIYRHRIVDPNGQVMTLHWIPDPNKALFRTEKTMHRTLVQMGFCPVLKLIAGGQEPNLCTYH